MAQFHWDPATYLELMREEVPAYERLQSEAVAATGGVAAERILELGTGTGEAARRLLAAHPAARLEGLDASDAMLTAARRALDPRRVRLRVARLEEPLGPGPFDLVVSVLAVHHLDDAGKADLFARAAAVLRPGGRLVLGDVVVPDDPADAVAPLEPGVDLPSPAADQLRWIAAAGLRPRLAWAEGDLAVLVGDAP
jgi:tRNA (cmo5U34)-methyltransferase